MVDRSLSSLSTPVDIFWMIDFLMAGPFQGYQLLNLKSGMFHEFSSLLWQESIVSGIRNILFFIRWSFITSRSFSENTKTGLSESTAISAPSFRMLSRSILIAAIRCVDLLASGVWTVGRSASSCFPARLAASILPVMQNGGRSGESGCRRSFCSMSLTVRLSSPSLRCCDSSSFTRELSFLHYLWQPSRPS
jgi:hypothetical protein